MSARAGPRCRAGPRWARHLAPVVGATCVLALLATGCAPGTWASAAPAGFARQEVSFVYVPSVHEFFLAGGLSTVQEAYDPATNAWHTVAPLPAALDHIQGVEVGGRVYYVGGLSAWPRPSVGTVYIYDPVADSFRTGTPMPPGRDRGAGGVAVHQGRIYYAGGLHNGSAVPWFDVYDPVTDTWASLPDLPESRDHFQAAVVGNRFYAIGGRKTLIDDTTTVNDAFDFGTGTWVTGLAPLPTARGGFAAVALGTTVLVIGGEGDDRTYGTVEAYDTTDDSWTRLADMPLARHGIEGATCNGGIHIADGGTREGGSAPTSVHQVLFPGEVTTCP